MTEKAKRLLRIQMKESCVVQHFDRQKEQDCVSEAVTKFLLKRGAAGTSSEVLGMAMFPFHHSNIGGRQKCLHCDIEERKLESGKKLLRCSRCGNAVYCGEGCQREDWKIHKNVCVRADLAKKTNRRQAGQKNKKRTK